MEYEIVVRKNLEDLINTVNEQIRMGWKPIAGFLYDGKYYCQTIIREEKHEKRKLKW
jgi:hypothetical protein